MELEVVESDTTYMKKTPKHSPYRTLINIQITEQSISRSGTSQTLSFGTKVADEVTVMP